MAINKLNALPKNNRWMSNHFTHPEGNYLMAYLPCPSTYLPCPSTYLPCPSTYLSGFLLILRLLSLRKTGVLHLARQTYCLS